MEWESKSAEKSGSVGSFEPANPGDVWGGRPDPSGYTTKVSDTVKESRGTWEPPSAHPENERSYGVTVPKGGTYHVPNLPWESESADWHGSNSNITE